MTTRWLTPHRATRLLAAASLLHVTAEFRPPTSAAGATRRLIIVAAVAAALQPRRATTLALTGLVVVSAATEAPIVGNHWVLAAALATCIAAHAAVPRWPWNRTVAGIRGVTLTAYAFMALSKYNNGFVDPTSCAGAHLTRAADAIGLTLPVSAAAATALGWTVLAIETAIVVGLATRRTRRVTVFAAIAFHSALVADLPGHFHDFSSVLLLAFTSFLDTTPLRGRLEHQDLNDPGRTSSFDDARHTTGPWAAWTAAAALTATATTVIAPTISAPANTPTGQILYFILASRIAWHLHRTRDQLTAAPARWRDAHALTAVVLIVALNGAAGYTGHKTAWAWNMYSNVQITDGQSNHWLIPAPPPGEAPLTVTDGPAALLTNATDGWAYPPSELRIAATRAGQTITATTADGQPVAIPPGTDSTLDRFAVRQPVHAAPAPCGPPIPWGTRRG
jgi:hypothetical protein